MWGAIITGVLGLAQLGYGAYQKGKANKAAKDNVQPAYPISQLYADNLGLATQEASYGFSPETLKSFSDISTQNLQSGIDSTLRLGGTASDVAKLYGINTTANRGLMMANDQFKAQKLTNFFDQSAQMAGQQGTKWRLDYYNRWKDRAVAAAQMQQNANSQITGGINTLGSAATQFGQIASVNRIPKSKESGVSNASDEATDGVSDGIIEGTNTAFNINNSFGVTSSNPFIVNNNPYLT